MTKTDALELAIFALKELRFPDPDADGLPITFDALADEALEILNSMKINSQRAGWTDADLASWASD